MSGFFGLDIAMSALRASQYAMNTVAHNISNANTPGYRRQDVQLVAGMPISGLPGLGQYSLGTGVVIQSVRRAQTDFADAQIRQTNQWHGQWNARNTALAQLEPMLAEPSDNGLSAALNKFWNSWSDLSTSPLSSASRVAVVENGVALAHRIQGLYQNMRSLQIDAETRITSKADEINLLAQEIAALNGRITEPVAGIAQPNDLMDKRDMLIDRLSQIAQVTVNGTTGINMIISIGGKSLVQGTQVSKVETAGGLGTTHLIWADNGNTVSANGGELAGLAAVRDLIGEYMDSLDTIASTLVGKVNELHAEGATMSGDAAGDFFTADTTAANISVHADILSDPTKVAAGLQDDGPNENTVAKNIAELRTTQIAELNGKTIGAAYTALVTHIGSNTGEALTRTEIYAVSLEQLKVQRESVAGVSIDEEMVNMTKFQQAYNAAARIFTVMDEMMDTLINRTGITGR